jgi:DMSO/TMAO reductase YedYZ molybdopterin-dependent catalytic subunit
VIRATRLVFGSVADLFAGEVTPNGEFYVVSKNLDDPAVNPSTWSLSVDGLVENPVTLSSDELMSRTAADEFVTLECVSNPVGGNLIGNARWSGVPLADLIDEARPKSEATWVILTCADGYTVGVPLVRARAPTSLLALHMNGERLPRRHGFPVRVLVPGLYGMFHAKWLNRITFTDREFVGYWQQKGWTNAGAIRPTAIIAVVPTQAARGQQVSVGGVALAGDRRVTRVEVSDDGGATWDLATLKPPLAPTAWTLWTYAWTPSASGSVRLQARAWSQDGGLEETQDSASAGPYPVGASGYDSVQVAVA